MSGIPIEVGSRKQLLFDERFFGNRRGISLVVNRPYQDPEPVLCRATALRSANTLRRETRWQLFAR